MESGAHAAVFREAKTLRLTGNVRDISRSELYLDHKERITVAVEGAEPLYAELRLPNVHGWVVGQQVVLVIATVSQGNAWESLT
jgi:hypothetical protein